MSHDVHVEEPQGRLAPPCGPGGGPGGAAGADAWNHAATWEAVLVFTVLASALFAVLSDPALPSAWAAAGLLLALLPLYYVLGRPAIRCASARRTGLYFALLVLLFAVAAYLDPVANLVLFGLYPQCFIAAPYRRALVVAAALAFTPPLLTLVFARDATALLVMTALAVSQVAFAALFGFWIGRIITQSSERARLIKELEDSRAEVARLSAERGALAERERLAGEIHDTLAQGFTSIIMLVQAAQAQPDPSRHLKLAVRTARENLSEARALIAALAPAPLDGSTLADALNRLTARLGEETGLASGFETRGTSRALPPPVDVVLVRAAQEGLSNVRKHARASRVRVELEYGDREVALRIMDDGAGLSPALGHDGYGLRAMRTRVEQAGGVLRVDGVPGVGTTLEIFIPDKEL